MKAPIQQAKEHILEVLRGVDQDVKQIIYPCLPQDLTDFCNALDLIEVKAEFERRGVTASVKVVSKTGEPLPDIVIATIDDLTSGKVEEKLKNRYQL